jgi:hypothetical protein
MTKKVFGLDTQPGIQRDGTVTDRNFYNDGQWVRFQRARPRKILGYREIVSTLAGPSRGIYLDPSDQFSTVYSGYSDGLQSVQINEQGLGAGLLDFTLTNFTPSNRNLWQFDALFDSSGSGRSLIVAHPGQNLESINNQVNTPVLAGETGLTTMEKIGDFSAVGSTNSTNTITLNAANFLVGAGQLVTGAGIPANTFVVSITSGITVLLTNAATATAGTVTFTFDNQVSVSGGVVVLHPYLFVYGNNGLIKNSSAGNVNDWVSSDSNETNVASTKIVKGLPVRGGSNAPSGLFWSLESLIRVSYTPTTVTVGGTASTFYWRYDIITSQSSILSSQCVIEYDGIYYWIGVDRFLMYNGVVKEVPNSMNQNFFFDNLNFAQRQKVYATKVPRFGEVWWFYPTNGSDECNNAIIYNVRENTWYDAGQADGARRSAGYFSQVFHYPINANTRPNATGAINTTSILAGGSNYVNGVYPYTVLSGGGGAVSEYSTAVATITVSGNTVTDVQILYKGLFYEVDDQLTASLPSVTFTLASVSITGTGGQISFTATTGVAIGQSITVTGTPSVNRGIVAGTYYVIATNGTSTATLSSTLGGTAITTIVGATTGLTFVLNKGIGFILNVNSVQTYYSLYQHEIGLDDVSQGNFFKAINSYFETNNLGLVTGGPSQQSLIGENAWIRLERIEPDFVQTGPLDLYITGRPYAQADDKTTGPYTFFPDTHKIDMKEQRRELRIKVQSNVAGGDYQLGYMILNADIGDVRGY